jgi:hypothetical protein
MPEPLWLYSTSKYRVFSLLESGHEAFVLWNDMAPFSEEQIA